MVFDNFGTILGLFFRAVDLLFRTFTGLRAPCGSFWPHLGLLVPMLGSIVVVFAPLAGDSGLILGAILGACG